MCFIKLIWWIRTHPIFQNFDQRKMSEILLYILSNLFDSTNLMKLIWPYISDDLSIVDWFSVLIDFQWPVNSRCYLGFHTLLHFEHQVFLVLDKVFSYQGHKERHKEAKTRWSTREILSSVSPVQLCYK